MNMYHIPFEKLVDLAEDRLTSAEREGAIAHTSACSRCAVQLTRLERMIEMMRTDTTEDAPPHVIARALRLFPVGVQTAAENEPSGLRRLLADLLLDSAKLSPAFGVRAAQSAAARQLLFSVGEGDIDLRVAQSDEGWVVSGQVLGQYAGGEVELRGEAGAEQARLNELCEFVLPPVPKGTYTLLVRMGDYSAEIPDLEIGS